MAIEPLRVACLGMGWWSDVLADAILRTEEAVTLTSAIDSTALKII